MVEKSSSSSVVVFPRIRRCPMMLAMEESSWMMMDDVVVIASDNDVTRIRSNFIMDKIAHRLDIVCKLCTMWIQREEVFFAADRTNNMTTTLVRIRDCLSPPRGLFSALLHDRFSPASHWRARLASSQLLLSLSHGHYCHQHHGHDANETILQNQ